MAASKSLTPTERSARAQLAAHARWANDPDRDQIRRAQKSSPTAVEYWLARVEADHPDLTPAIRRKLATSKRNEYMARLTYRRERARSRARKEAS
jgi:hypothetical protein